MKGLKVSFYLFIVLLLISCGEKKQEKMTEETVPEPEYGKIITVEEADSKFGRVEIERELLSTQMESFVEASPDFIMFFLDDTLKIANQSRSVIYPPNGTAAMNDTFTVYNASKVTALIKDGGASVTYVQKRTEKLTIANGRKVLEFGAWCPPYCAPPDQK